MIPTKLQPGDEIRIIAPSRSLSMISERDIAHAQKVLSSLRFHITFGKHVREMDMAYSSSIESRIADLHQAFADKSVKAILTVIGGFNVNQLLPYLDYDLIKQNPKILCGYSDITALCNAIYAKTGLVTYSGPHFSSFGMVKGMEYTLEYFQKCFSQTEPLSLSTTSKTWSDDQWYIDQKNRTFIPHEGVHVIQEGEAEGTIIGGNLCTLNLLQGTEYMPSLKGCILFLEDDSLVDAPTFDRDLESLLQLPGSSEIKGLLIGRFQQKSQMTREKLEFIIQNKKQLRGLPVMADLNFGHTTPIFTFPIGGTATISVKNQASLVEIQSY
ncbi:muramoyltetrapeptide carboxypeptidase [Croceifilum oryzae]|uniref:Muramoyltetrapeptide carboxypeptidase n=1 Tax=Croceifilum oryzae TaxID=1553429 RepID=A0AAJ1TP19_9BACL|nr:S66 peptidase family protein [Croceifilum oryzae]MDQ0417976.1 muramoyltetrapeptide carboxypeptidase [Croceifilum oryzae]